jgi:poly(3-hydroxyalkanoate) synthetase
MFDQTQDLIKEINKIKRENNITRFNFVGFSQGGLLGRAALMLMDNHGCENYISMAAPQSGIYGFFLLDRFFPNFTVSL